MPRIIIITFCNNFVMLRVCLVFVRNRHNKTKCNAVFQSGYSILYSYWQGMEIPVTFSPGYPVDGGSDFVHSIKYIIYKQHCCFNFHFFLWHMVLNIFLKVYLFKYLLC